MAKTRKELEDELQLWKDKQFRLNLVDRWTNADWDFADECRREIDRISEEIKKCVE